MQHLPSGQVLHSGDLICEGTILAGKVLHAAAIVAPTLAHSEAMAAGKPKQAAEENGHALQKPINGDIGHLPTNGNLENKKHVPTNGNLEDKEHLPTNGNLEHKYTGSRLDHLPSNGDQELKPINGGLEHPPTNGDLQHVPTNGVNKQLPTKNAENEVVCLQAPMLPCKYWSGYKTTAC